MNAHAHLLIPPDRPMPVKIPGSVRRIVVILIQPTQYDDDGFPHRYRRVIVPSNSLAVLNALTKDAFRELQLPQQVEIHLYEDRVRRHSRELARIYRRFPEHGTLLIVGLVGVQTGQFPRAADLTRRWQKAGATCVIGGPHVTGSLATMYHGVADPRRPNIPCPHQMPAEIQQLMDRGTIIFDGEAEGTWPKVLADIAEGHPQQLYRGGQPDITNAPLPDYPLDYLKRNFATNVETIDEGRGCPYVCSFCVAINVQGRIVRPRSPARIVAHIRAICERDGKASIFFVGDNFSRSKSWEELLDGLIELRRQGYKICFMLQADLKSHVIPRFIEKLAAAGCDQIFMGVESMNPGNLRDANKKQNNVAAYEEFWRECNKLGIMVHASIIVGLNHDTPESFPVDVARLHQLGANFASFFIKTLLPGSEDHARAVAAGVPIDPDLTKLDSFHATSPHPRMTKEQWEETYRRAWEQFYTTQNMITAIKRCANRHIQRYLLRYFFWARWSFATERTHPMLAGFYRVRDYADRRPGSAELSYGRFMAQEVLRHLRYVCRLCGELLRFQQVMFEVDLAPLLAEKRQELSGKLHGAGDWFRRTFGRAASREWLNAFWREYAGKKWRLLSPHTYHLHLLTVPHLLSEFVYLIRAGMRIPYLIKVATRR